MALRKTSITLQPDVEAKLLDIRKKLGGDLYPAHASQVIAIAIGRMHSGEFPEPKNVAKKQREKKD